MDKTCQNQPAKPDAAASQLVEVGISAPGTAALSPTGNTIRAYKSDWAHFSRWCRLQGTDPLAATPQTVALYLADLAAPSGSTVALSRSTIERRLAGVIWNAARRGVTLDRKDKHIVAVLEDIQSRHARPTTRKETIQPDDIRAMVATLPFDLRGLRDRAILLLAYAGSLRRSEIVSLDVGENDTADSGGWIEILDGGALITLHNRYRRREVEIGRGSFDSTCPVHAVEEWLYFARIGFGPVFVRTSRDGKRALGARLGDKHVARLVKACVLNSGIRSDLPVAERLMLFSGHSLRLGLSGSEGTHGDRFRINLTKAAGL